MKKSKTLTLIEGTYSHEDSKEILMNMFSSKVNFLKIKNWSSNERYGKDDEIAQIKIPELHQETEKLLQIVSEAKSKNKKLVISSSINISLIDA